MKTFTLDKSRWMRGNDKSELLSLCGKQCCVGLFLSSVGVADDWLRRQSAASDLPSTVIPYSASWLLNANRDRNSRDAGSLYAINDNTSITDERRIAKMAPIFERNGFELVVVEGTE